MLQSWTSISWEKNVWTVTLSQEMCSWIKQSCTLYVICVHRLSNNSREQEVCLCCCDGVQPASTDDNRDLWTVSHFCWIRAMGKPKDGELQNLTVNQHIFCLFFSLWKVLPVLPPSQVELWLIPGSSSPVSQSVVFTRGVERRLLQHFGLFEQTVSLNFVFSNFPVSFCSVMFAL